MTVTFFDRQDETNPLNGRTLALDNELLEILHSLRNRTPFFAELLGENQRSLLVGVGGPIGSAQYSRTDGQPPYLMAVGVNPESSREYVEFLTGNTPTPIPSRYVIPFEVVKEIAVHFRQTGERSPALSWEEI
jgi:hypothetical protein